MKFLTKALKEKYMEDFNTNVLTSTDDYWAIDNGIREILIEINKNAKVQTIYSKNNSNFDGVSYLMLSIDRSYLNKIKKLEKKLTQKSKNYKFAVNEPSQFENDVTEKMGCNDDKDYFNVSVFSFFCMSHDLNEHTYFWKFLLENLVV